METDASKKGLHYRAANGSKVTTHGARITSGVSSNYRPINLAMNVADVKKTLASAYQIVQSGNKIILDAEYSYIVNKLSGENTPIEVINGEFQFDIWIPAPSEEHPLSKSSMERW